MQKNFLNENRTRYYGVRVGDRVRLIINSTPGMERFRDGEVVDLDLTDNNCVLVEWDGDGRHFTVPENLIIMVPVERWFVGKVPDAIVTKDPAGMPVTSQESLDHYGGYVIAESVPAPFINVILAAQPLLKNVEMFERMEIEGQISIWSDKRQAMNKSLRLARHGEFS